MRAFALLSLFVISCGVPQEIFNTRQRELDRCKGDLARSQSDLTASQKNADDLATESSDLRERVSSLQAERTKSASVATAQQANYEAFKNATQLAEHRAEIYQTLARYLQPLVDKKAVALDTVKGRLLVRMQEASLFESGHAELRPDGEALLRELASVLKQVNRDFLVACHTDNQPISAHGSSYHSAWELTLARSVAVVRFFQGEGVDPRRLGAAGYSEFNYLTDNNEETGRAQNRRIELIVMPTSEELIPLPKPTPPSKPVDAAPPAAPPEAKPAPKLDATTLPKPPLTTP